MWGRPSSARSMSNGKEQSPVSSHRASFNISPSSKGCKPWTAFSREERGLGGWCGSDGENGKSCLFSSGSQWNEALEATVGVAEAVSQLDSSSVVQGDTGSLRAIGAG